MRMAVLSVAGLAAIMAMAEAPQAAQAAREAVLRAGAANGANATFQFNKDAKPPAIMVHTKEAGVVGSRLEVTVDRARIPVFSHVLTADECKFAAEGSMCEILIPATDPAYDRIVAEFKRGLVARVTVLDAGVMKMDEKLSLLGFTKSFR